MKDEFTCAICGRTFEKGWSDEEAQQEYRENFGDIADIDEGGLVCDDCYKIHLNPAKKHSELLNRKMFPRGRNAYMEEFMKKIEEM